jgi:hypothetical protein
VTAQREPSHDLIVLVADSHQEAGIRTLLGSRGRDLGVPAITFEVRRHPRHDPGVYGEAADFLRPFLRTHRYALVLVDAAWEGAPPPPKMRSDITRDLRRNGWPDRSTVIVLEPEVEAWCWAVDAPEVEALLGLRWDELRQLGQDTGHWQAASPKPTAPKELLEASLRKSRTPRSARLYAELATRLPFAPCVDPAFVAFRETLTRWFGPAS